MRVRGRRIVCFFVFIFFSPSSPLGSARFNVQRLRRYLGMFVKPWGLFRNLTLGTDPTRRMPRAAFFPSSPLTSVSWERIPTYLPTYLPTYFLPVLLPPLQTRHDIYTSTHLPFSTPLKKEKKTLLYIYIYTLNPHPHPTKSTTHNALPHPPPPSPPNLQRHVKPNSPPSPHPKYLILAELLFLGRNYPQGFSYFRTRLHGAFSRQAHLVDEEEIRQGIKRAQFVKKGE